MFKKILNRAAGVSMALVLVAGVFAGCSDAFSASTDEAVNERAVFIEEGDRIYAVAESQPSDRLQFKLDLGSTSLSAGDEFTFYITYNKNNEFPTGTKLTVRDGTNSYAKWTTSLGEFGKNTGDSNKNGWYPVTVNVPDSYKGSTNQLGFTLTGPFVKGSVAAIKLISIAKTFKAESWKTFATDTQIRFVRNTKPDEFRVMPDASAVNPPEVSDPSVHVLRDAVVKNSSMITSTVNKDLTGCEIRFTGEWNQIKDKNYQKKLENLFYEYYPRILKRWGTENTHRVIYFKAGNFDFFAGASGNEIGINIDGANTSPEDIGYFAHELAHIVQGYNVDMNWFCEGMASYAGFRYFHWQHNDTLQPLYSKSQRIQTWTTYAPYGDCVPFFVYMDDKFPTYQKDGKKVLGLIDSIDQAAKNKTVRNVWNPDDPDTDLNRLVYKVTGGQYSTIEALRNQYLRECADGTWTFSGFADFKDNFLTQDVAGVNNTQQIAVKPISHASSAKNLSSLSLKENIFKGAKVVRSSGYIHDGEKDSFLVDGNTGSKWCARSGNVKDNTYAAHGAQHYILLDLGSEKNFDSYILHNTRSSEPSERNAVSWELLVSSDGKNFTSWDYQNGKNIDLGRFTPGSTSARYILMLVYEAELVYDSTHPYNSDESFDIVRLYELMGGLKK